MRYLLSVLLIVCVLLAHVLYIFQDQSFFHKQFTLLGSYERQPTVMEEANELMDYRYDDKELIDRDVYTLLEKQHLLDVQNIIQKIRLVFFVFLGLFLLLVLWSLISGFKPFSDANFLSAFVSSFLGFVLFFLGLALLSWISWDWLFDSFHRLFFVDNWSFDSQSFLIESYPWQFFRHAMVAIILRTLISLLVFIVLCFSYRHIRQ